MGMFNYPTLQNCLSGAVELNKNANINKYKYSGYGIIFDRGVSFEVLWLQCNNFWSRYQLFCTC